MGTVYIPQASRRRLVNGEWQDVHDFSSCQTYGHLRVLLPSGPVMTATSPMVHQLRRALQQFGDADYLVAAGDPAAIAAAAMVAARVNNGRVHVLRWDRKLGAYLPVLVDLNERATDEHDIA